MRRWMDVAALGVTQIIGAEEIAARCGVSAHVVKQRLRLGTVSPKLMQVYRDGGLSLDQLMAFAITEDYDGVAAEVQTAEGWKWTAVPIDLRQTSAPPSR